MNQNITMHKGIELLSGIICYVYFLITLFILGAMFPGYDHSVNYISELGAVDSPVMIYTNFLLFAVTGLLWAIFSVGLFRTIGRGNKWTGKIASILMFLSAITFLLIAFYPCDAGCNNFTATGITHGYISNAMVYFAIISLMFMTLGSLKGDFLSRKWFIVFLSVTITTSLLGLMYLQGIIPGPIFQRMTIALPFTLMGVISIYLYKTSFKTLK